jgi:hypothetical protein
MIKLKHILLESDDNMKDSDTWDDWYEYLDYETYAIVDDEIKKIIKKHNLHGNKYFNGKVIKIYDNKQVAYLVHDLEGQTCDLIKDIRDWVYSVDPSDLGIDSDTIYNGHVECNLKELRQNPGRVYHYTTEEKWDLIQESGYMLGSYGTGINNRSAHGIFTSVNPEEYANGAYGDICLELNLERFKQDVGKPELSLSFEPPIENYLVRTTIAHMLRLDMNIEHESDISPYTVIVHEKIPLRYVRVYGN